MLRTISVRFFGVVFGILFSEASLTAQEQIIDIDSTRNNEFKPIVWRFQPGSYRVIPIGRADGGAYDAYLLSYTVPSSWVHEYSLLSSEFPRMRKGDQRQWPTALQALAHSEEAQFTLTREHDVQFFIGDGALGDNQGGISLRVIPRETFKRGDTNGNGTVDIADAVTILTYLFNHQAITCLDAADTNDSGSVDIADAIGLLAYLFAFGFSPARPFSDCGIDPTQDNLGCEAFGLCQR